MWLNKKKIVPGNRREQDNQKKKKRKKMQTKKKTVWMSLFIYKFKPTVFHLSLIFTREFSFRSLSTQCHHNKIKTISIFIISFDCFFFVLFWAQVDFSRPFCTIYTAHYPIFYTYTCHNSKCITHKKYLKRIFIYIKYNART